MTYLTESEMRERLRAAVESAARRRAVRQRSRAERAITRRYGLQYRHASKLARMDRELWEQACGPSTEPHPAAQLTTATQHDTDH